MKGFQPPLPVFQLRTLSFSEGMLQQIHTQTGLVKTLYVGLPIIEGKSASTGDDKSSCSLPVKIRQFIFCPESPTSFYSRCSILFLSQHSCHTTKQKGLKATFKRYCRGPENDVHTRASGLRLILFSKDIGAF
jgi:hypothetical protein